MKIELKILDSRLNDPAMFPQYATAESAGFDLRACTLNGADFRSGQFTLRPGERIKIGTAVALDLGSHGEPWCTLTGMVLPRSGLGSRGITLGNAPGLLDADYAGEITLALWNSGDHEFVMKPLDRLAQLVIVPFVRAEFVRVDGAFTRTTERGEGGFGSTGVS